MMRMKEKMMNRLIWVFKVVELEGAFTLGCSPDQEWCLFSGYFSGNEMLFDITRWLTAFRL